jgi:hypothetical protein
VARAVRIASATIEAAFLPEPVLPARSRIPATTGAPWSVEMVVTSGDKPRRSTCLPEILVCPKLAPCLACPNTGRNSESMSTYACCPILGSSPVVVTSLTR